MTDESTNGSKNPGKRLTNALETAREDPENSEHWERVEDLADALQRPTDVKELYRSVLNSEELSQSLASEIGQRAVRFQEAWYGEDSAELPEILLRILEIDPQAEWAFQRLTVAYTVSERWEELLKLYDRTIRLTNETARKMLLLDEAAHVAKDFAGQPDRAIDYLTQLLSLDLTNSRLATSLERLLERQDRFQDLVKIWQSRLEVLPEKQLRSARFRIAQTAFEKLSDTSTTLSEIKMILKDTPDDPESYQLLERILSADYAPTDDRLESLLILKIHYQENDRLEDVIRILETSLNFVAGDQRIATLQDLTDRLVNLGQAPRAMEHQARLLVLEPTPEVQELLLALAEQTHMYELYTDAFVEAADVCQRPQVTIGLLMEAAKVRWEQMSDEETAIDLYQRVFGSPDTQPETKLTAGRCLNQLLERARRDEEWLKVLQILQSLELDAKKRRQVLVQLARLANRLDNQPLTIEAWKACLEVDGSDLEAMDALIEIRQANREWHQLISLLHQRLQHTASASQKRNDLTLIAQIQSEYLNNPETAIEIWLEIQKTFGEDRETVSALAHLLSHQQRWVELAEVIKGAADRETSRFTGLQVQLGDIYRERLDKLEEAAECYRKTLHTDPLNPQARAGLSSLLESDRTRKKAVETLIRTFEQNGEWQNCLEIMEYRLSVIEDPETRATILATSADLYEKQHQDLESALSCLLRAFSLMPSDRNIEEEMHRLAGLLDMWKKVVEAYREAINNLDKSDLETAELFFKQGKVLEDKLNIQESALVAYSEAVQIVPDNLEMVSSAVNTSACLNHWGEATQTLMVYIQKTGRIEPSLFYTIETIASQLSAWDEATKTLTQVLANTGNLSSEIMHEIEIRIAQWYQEKIDDKDAAEAALLRAVKHKKGVTEVLNRLAELQRRTPSLALNETLLQLANIDDHNLDPLYEAANIAREYLEDREIEISNLQRLYIAASTLFKQGIEPKGNIQVDSCITWALDRLIELYSESSDHKKAVEYLIETSTLPFDVATTQSTRHKAASIAAHALGETNHAIEIYCDIIEIDPKDVEAIRQLGMLYERENMLSNLFVLRQQELMLDVGEERKLELRLDLARIFNILEERGGSVRTLRENLEQKPGHKLSIDALTNTLLGKGQHTLLVGIYNQQAEILSKQDKEAKEYAAHLWWRAAEISERDLRDIDQAISYYQKHFELDPRGEATTHLARIYTQRNEYDNAAQWLEKRLEQIDAERHTEVAILLATTYLKAEKPQNARISLERSLLVSPSSKEIRELLADRYRIEESYSQLAVLLSEGTQYLSDPQQQLEYIKEAADIYFNKLNTKQRATPILRLAVKINPEDRRLQVMLAESFHEAQEFDQAREVLEKLIVEFGRKRSPERAELHFKYAQVSRDAGNIEQALQQLEMATKMDLSHVRALQMMAQLARKQGELERSERAYRGLLMLLKQNPPHREDSLGPSVVFCELAELAKERGNTEQAEELLESAFESTIQSEAEVNRLEKALLKNQQIDLLLRLYNTRLKGTQQPQVEAEILSAKAGILEQMKKPHEALDARLKALRLDPDSSELHQATSALAARIEQMQRYIDSVTSLIESTQRKQGKKNKRLLSKLLLLLGEAIEKELGDLDRAVGLYARVEASGEYIVQAWLALARVAGARGDHNEQRRVLQHISDLTEEDAPEEERIEALFHLAELELNQEDTRDKGIETLSKAISLESDPENKRSRSILERVVKSAPDDAKLLSLYQKVARASGDQRMLLDYLERRASFEDVTIEEIKEGVDLALLLHQPEKAEPLLSKAKERVQDEEDDPASTCWIFSNLAQCRKQAGDIKGAIEFLRQAAERSVDEQKMTVLKQLAETAATPDGDLEVAAEAYQRLLETTPSDREIWEPLLQVYRCMSDRERFEKLVNDTLFTLLDTAERSALRMNHAQFLIDKYQDDQNAVPILQEIISEDPDHAEAFDLLLTMYQRNNRNEDLAELLSRQYDRARDQQDLDTIAKLGLRIGKLLEPTRPQEAIDIYRSSLEWVSEDRELLQSLLALLGPDSDQRERAEVMQQMLKIESGEAAASLAIELSTIWESLDDEEMQQQAIELGYQAYPQSDTIRNQLEKFYLDREKWPEMAKFLSDEAKQANSPMEAVARLKNAATIYRENVGDINASADALRKALELLPKDLSLLAELARNLAAAGEHRTAIEDVSKLLSSHPEDDSTKVDLLRVRADLYLAIDEHAKAVSDLEDAYAIEKNEVAANLVDALFTLKQSEMDNLHQEAARAANLRLVQVLQENGNEERARNILSEWIEQDQSDIDAMRLLRSIDTKNERWEDVARVCEHLIDFEQSDVLAETAIGLAEACEKSGNLNAGLSGLEKAYNALPHHEQIRAYLKMIYQQTGNNQQLAQVLTFEANITEEPKAKIELLQYISQLLLNSQDASAALIPLSEAQQLDRENDTTTVLFVDALSQLGRLDEASDILNDAIETHKRKRSPELALLQQRMARLAALTGGADLQLEWLSQAMETDRKNPEIAAELAEAAMALQNYDLAMKALRAITMMSDPSPMSRAEAFLKQAQIAYQQNDQRRAQHWARKAKSLDPNLDGAESFLIQLTEDK